MAERKSEPSHVMVYFQEASTASRDREFHVMHIVPCFSRLGIGGFFLILMGDGIIAMGSFGSRVSPCEEIGDWRLARISLPIDY